MADETYNLQAVLSATDDGFTSLFNKVENSIDKLENKQNSATATTEKFGVSVKSLASSFGILKIASGVFNTIGNAMDSAFSRIDTMEQFDRTMGVIIGDAERVEKSIQSILDTTDGTAYSLDGFAKALQKLVTSGTDISLAEKSLKSWGDAVAFYGDASQQSFDGVADALSKMATKGKVDMEQLGRLMNNGIPVVDIYAKAVGKSTESVASDISKGKISTQEFMEVMDKAFINGVDGFASIENAAKNAGATWKTTFSNMKFAMARGVTEIIKSTDKMVQSFGFEDLRSQFKAIGKFGENQLKSIAKAIDIIGDSSITTQQKVSMIKEQLKGFIPILSLIATYQTIVFASPLLDLYHSKTQKILNGLSNDLKKVTMQVKENYKAWQQLANTKLNDLKLNASNFLDDKGITSKINSITSKLKNIKIPKMDIISNKFSIGKDMLNLNMENLKFDVSRFFDTSKVGQKLSGVSATVKNVGGQVGNILTATTQKAFAQMKSMISLGMKLINPMALVGVVLMGMGILYNQFGTQINAFLNVAKNSGVQIITQFAQGIATEIPTLLSYGVALLTQLAQVIAINLPTLITQGVAIINALIQGLVQNMDAIINSAVIILASLIDGIMQNLPTVVLMGMQLLLGLVQGIMSNLDTIMMAVYQILSNFINAVSENLPQILSTGIQILQSLIQGITDALPMIIMIVAMILSKFITTIVENLPQILMMGLQLIQSLIQGIVENLPLIISAVIQLIGTIITTIIENLPQILMMGIEILKTLAMGILQAIPQFLLGAFEGVKGAFSNFKNWIKGNNEEVKENNSQTLETMATDTSAKYSQMSQQATISTSELANNVGLYMGQAKDNMMLNTTEMATNTNDAFTTIGATGTSEIDALTNGVSSQFSNANSSVGASTEQMASSVENNVSRINASMVSGVSDATNQITSNFNQINAIVGSTMQNIANATSTGTNAMASAMASGFNKAVAVVNTSCISISNRLNNLASSTYSIGYNSGLGFNNGLASTQSRILATADRIANGVINKMNNALKIGSPSRKLYKTGAWSGQGYNLGLQSEYGSIMDTTATITNGVMNNFNNMGAIGVKSTKATQSFAYTTTSKQSETKQQPLIVYATFDGVTYQAFADDIYNKGKQNKDFNLKFTRKK